METGCDLLCPDYGSRILNNLLDLKENDVLCDLTLVADSFTTRVHRSIMAASSDYFKAMLTADMKEKGQKSITLKGIPGKGLSEIVAFVYTGKLHCTMDNISDLLVASTHLQLNEATELCSQYLVQLTTMKNSVDMYNLAEQFNLPKLKHKALYNILDHFEDIGTRRDYLRFSETFLAEILEDNRLKVYNELTLFQLVMSWVNHNRTERAKYMFYLMSRIRFPLISPEDLVEIVMNEPLMKNDPQCLDLILEANKYHMLPSKQPLMQTLRTQVRNSNPSLIILDGKIDIVDGPMVYDIASRSAGRLPMSHVETFHSKICTMQNYMYVCGGLEILSTNTPVSAKCYRYDPRFDNWCIIAPLQEARHNFALCSDNHRSLFAIGGFSNGVYNNIVEQYLLHHDRWVLKQPMATHLASTAAATHNGTVYLSGGQNELGITCAMSAYNIKTDSWKDCPPMLWHRMDHTMACYKNQLFVIGGYNKNIVKAIDVAKVECFDIETNQWSAVHDSSPKISGITACSVGPEIYMVGGFSYDENRKRGEVWCYNVETNEWHVETRLASPEMSVPVCILYLPRTLMRFLIK